MNTTLPDHIAIIMDGNRRWAREHNLPVLEGHRRVVGGVLERLIGHAADLGIGYLTLWAWSTENWKRTEEEVSGIMNLLRWGFKKFGDRMHKKGIRIRVIGDTKKFSPDIQETLSGLIEKTKNNSRITVIFALNYGGRDEIVRAIRAIPETERGAMTEEEFSGLLDSSGIPDPELVIRTGGEQRLSGFLLWQTQYSELYFAPWYMPDFTPEHLDEAIGEYSTRIRRFGK